MGPKITNVDTGREGPIDEISSVLNPSGSYTISGKLWVVEIQNPENVNAVSNISNRRTNVTGGNQLQLYKERS